MPKRNDINKILIIGSGPIIIGQACEFDYSGTQACKALRKLGYEIVLVNSNPATIMTDPETADKTYIEPLNVNRLEQIIAKERPDALLPNLGGQSGLNLCAELHKAGILDKYNVKVIGVQVDAIERGEDRIEFKKAMDELDLKYAAELKDKIADLKEDRDAIVAKYTKYNNNVDEKELKYQKERQEDIEKYLKEQREEKVKEDQKQREYEEKYGYSGEKLKNYSARYNLAFDFYMSLDADIAVEALQASPNMKFYLGNYYDKLMEELKNREGYENRNRKYFA